MFWLGLHHSQMEAKHILICLENCIQEELKRRDEIEELLEKLNQEKTVIEQNIKVQMKDAVYAESGDYAISWVPSVQHRIDTTRLKEEQPEVYRKYLKDISSR